MTIGLDLGDKSSAYCVLDGSGAVVSEHRVRTTPKARADCFSGMAISRIALETGTHSPWIGRLLSGIGHKVIVANARHVRLIAQSRQKDDRLDARTLARLARVDPKLLSPVTHRSAQAHADLSLIHARAALVRSRATLINTARGLVKTNGERLHGSSSRIIKSDVSMDLSPALRVSMEPVLESIKALTLQIREYNRKIINLGKTSYPEVSLLTQVHGVGPLVALTYILTLEDLTVSRRAAMRAATSVCKLRAATLEAVSLNYISPRKAIHTFGRCLLKALTIFSDHLERTAT